MTTTSHPWLWVVLYAAGIALLLSQCSYGATPAGTLVTLAATATADNCGPSSVERQVIVVSPAQYSRVVYPCPYNSKPPGKPGVVVDRVSWAAGWKIKRRLNYGAGCPEEVVGVQTADGAIWTETGLVR